MTTDKRAAAIAAVQAALAELASLEHTARGWVGSAARDWSLAVVGAASRTREALAALEDDDGRALLRQLREIRDAMFDREGAIKKAMRGPAALNLDQADAVVAVPLTYEEVMARMDKLLAAPEQPAPEPAASVSIREGALQGAPTRGPVLTDRAEIDALKKRAFDAAQPEPAAPHADDEARIAEAEESMTLVVDTRPSVETLRTLVCSAVTMMRSLAAGKAKAEAEVERLTGVIDDTTNTEATNADTVADLREKLADAQADVERLRGRDAEPFDWDAAPSVQEWIDENLPEREPRAGSKMVELHPDEVIADRGESRRVAGWLKDLMAENARLRAERDAAQENLAWAMKQRDAALAAQNARAGLLGRAVEAISECLPDEDLNDLSTHFHMECKRHHFERLKDVRDEMECALRAAKPEPAAEPVPAAADAKPGDEVLREFLRSHATDSYSSDIELMADTVAWLCRRALEVRP